jgi:hypothetical protein
MQKETGLLALGPTFFSRGQSRQEGGRKGRAAFCLRTRLFRGWYGLDRKTTTRSLFVFCDKNLPEKKKDCQQKHCVRDRAGGPQMMTTLFAKYACTVFLQANHREIAPLRTRACLCGSETRGSVLGPYDFSPFPFFVVVMHRWPAGRPPLRYANDLSTKSPNVKNKH